jgi:hypothetical protein
MGEVLEVRILKLDGATAVFRVESFTTILMIKERLREEMLMWPWAAIKLLYRGQNTADEDTLATLGFSSGQRLHMMQGMMEGG